MVITTDAIKRKLMDTEPEDSDANSAFACFRRNHSFINQSKNVKSVQSMAKKDGGNAQVSTSIKGKQNVKYYSCKQHGHYRNQCTFKCNKDPENKSSKTSNAFSAVFFNRILDENDRYVDSGASSHLTSNKDWMIDGCYSGIKKEIVMAN
ncbi:unnamed protein product [Hermetia illucens]|uniref:CCHC-type domain-containing protein n=1 Tax=Hermetia illucens TaxID=343691 RepID=A0A7R8ULP1_HERIL|nr:unnamed protein product [Hermetia illucens]